MTPAIRGGGHEAEVADQFRDAAGRGPEHHLVGRARLQDIALVHHEQPVREGLRVRELVGDEDRRHLTFGRKIFDKHRESAPQGFVETRERLVKQQRVAVREQQPPECHAVPLAAGQPGGHHGQQLVDAELPGDRRELRAGRGPRVQQVGAHRQVREQPGVLPQQSHPPLPRRHLDSRGTGRREHPAAQLHQAAARPDQARDRLEHRRLACPRRTEQCHPLPGGHRQRRMDGEVAAVNLDVGGQHGRSTRRRPSAAAARPRAAPGQTAARTPAPFPAGSRRSATGSRTDGRR